MPRLQAVVRVLRPCKPYKLNLAVEVNLHDNYSLRPLFGMKKYQKSCDNGAIVLQSTWKIGDIKPKTAHNWLYYCL